VQAKQNKEFICHFLSAGRCSATSRKAGLIACNGFLGRQMPLLQMFPPSALHLHLLLLSVTPQAVGHPFGQPGSPVLDVSPHSSWCTLSLPAGRAAREAEKFLAPCERCSATAQTLVSYHHSFHLKRSIIQTSTKEVNSIPAKTMTVR